MLSNSDTSHADNSIVDVVDAIKIPDSAAPSSNKGVSSSPLQTGSLDKYASPDIPVTGGLTVKITKQLGQVGAKVHRDQDVTQRVTRGEGPSNTISSDGRYLLSKSPLSGRHQGSAFGNSDGLVQCGNSDSPNTVLQHGPDSQAQNSPRQQLRLSGMGHSGGYTPFLVYSHPPMPPSRFSNDGVNQPPSPLMGSPVSTPTAMMFPQTPFAGARHHHHLSPYASGAFPNNPFAPDIPMSPQHSGHYGYFHPIFNNFSQFMPTMLGSRNSLSRSSSIGYPKPPPPPPNNAVKRKPSSNRLASGGGCAEHPAANASGHSLGSDPYLGPSDLAHGALGSSGASSSNGTSVGQRTSISNNGSHSRIVPPKMIDGAEGASGWNSYHTPNEMLVQTDEKNVAANGSVPPFTFQDGVPLMPWMMQGMGLPPMPLQMNMHPYHYQMLMLRAMPHMHGPGMYPFNASGERVSHSEGFEFHNMSANGFHSGLYTSPMDMSGGGIVYAPPPPPPGLGNTGMMGTPANRFGATTPQTKPVRRRNVSELKIGPDGVPRLNARQRRTLRRAKERALKGLMEAGHVLLQRNEHLMGASGTDSSGIDSGQDSSRDGSDEEGAERRAPPRGTKGMTRLVQEGQPEIFPGSNAARDQTELYLGAAISVASGSAGPEAAQEAAKALSKAAADLDEMDIGSLINHLTHKKVDAAVDEKLIRDLQIIQNLIGAVKLQGQSQQHPFSQKNPRPSNSGSPPQPALSAPTTHQQWTPTTKSLSNNDSPVSRTVVENEEQHQESVTSALQTTMTNSTTSAAIGKLPLGFEGLGMQMQAIMDNSQVAT